MREIKFRAWDTHKDEMRYDMSFSPKGAITLEDIFNGPTGLSWMQFTGLHDKNGTEIYEGDVLKFKFVKEGERSAVEWDEKMSMGWVLEPVHVTLGWMNDESSLEVIGNIYENPHLLETSE